MNTKITLNGESIFTASATIDQEKALALANFLEIDEGDITNNYSDEFSYNHEQYLIFNEDEADQALDDYIDNFIQNFVYAECPEWIHRFIDQKEVVEAVIADGRGSALATYDGIEEIETVNENEYYLYRIN